jgi:hypothetical protein
MNLARPKARIRLGQVSSSTPRRSLPSKCEAKVITVVWDVDVLKSSFASIAPPIPASDL